LGYKTFDKWIDESYDTIDDQVERFYSAISSIKKFVDQDAETLDEIMKEILPVLEHNVQVLDHNNEHLYKDFKQSLVDSLGK
jgi:gas vesicle protein